MESKQSHVVNRTYGPLHKFPTELTFSLVVHQPITYPHTANFYCCLPLFGAFALCTHFYE